MSKHQQSDEDWGVEKEAFMSGFAAGAVYQETEETPQTPMTLLKAGLEAYAMYMAYLKERTLSRPDSVNKWFSS